MWNKLFFINEEDNKRECKLEDIFNSRLYIFKLMSLLLASKLLYFTINDLKFIVH